MIIKDGFVFTESKTFEQKDIYIKKHQIVESMDELSMEEREVYDATGCYVIPGLIDVHSHGAIGVGISYASKEDIRRLLQYERSKGITSYCPTTMSMPKDNLLKVCQIIGELKKEQRETDCTTESSIEGIHLEGPFLEEAKKGAHASKYLCKADIAFVEACMEQSGGLVKLMTVGPEQEGVLDLIKALGEKIHFSLGHTKTTYETAKEAIRLGADHITHLYNGMEMMNAREPGVIMAAKDMGNIFVEIICDGIHVHESMVKLAFEIFKGQMVLVSDSVDVAGISDGEYPFGERLVIVKNGKATFEDGTIIGSASNLFDCMCHAIKIGIPMEEAVAAATMNPAKSIDIFEKVGSITPGKRADILILDKNLILRKILS